MPYIKQDQRPSLDAVLNPLIEHLSQLPETEQDGAINYAVTRVLSAIYPQKYFHFNRALGVLSAITQEYYRRRVGPYEDTKITENGDVE